MFAIRKIGQVGLLHNDYSIDSNWFPCMIFDRKGSRRLLCNFTGVRDGLWLGCGNLAWRVENISLLVSRFLFFYPTSTPTNQTQDIPTSITKQGHYYLVIILPSSISNILALCYRSFSRSIDDTLVVGFANSRVWISLQELVFVFFFVRFSFHYKGFSRDPSSRKLWCSYHAACAIVLVVPNELSRRFISWVDFGDNFMIYGMTYL